MHRDPLADLVKLLRKGPLTAGEIAAIEGCSKPTAYKRLQTLQARPQAKGFVVYTVMVVDRTRPGPQPLAYGIR